MRVTGEEGRRGTGNIDGKGEDGKTSEIKEEVFFGIFIFIKFVFFYILFFMIGTIGSNL